MQTKTDLEIAESFVDWAAVKKMTAANVWRTLNSWPALHLTDNEKEYIRVLSERHCPAQGWTREIRLCDGLKWVAATLEKRKNETL